jgi:hypothetical protein
VCTREQILRDDRFAFLEAVMYLWAATASGLARAQSKSHLKTPSIHSDFMRTDQTSHREAKSHELSNILNGYLSSK